MATDTGWAVFLRPNVPTQFLELFASYLSESHGAKYLLTSEFHPGQYVGLALVRTGEVTDWEVQIPPEFILAVAKALREKRPA